MKYFLTIILFTFCLQVRAQVVGENAYLQSPFVEMGMNSVGNFMTNTPPPAGYVPAPYQRGIIADAGKDGWDTGIPAYSGDYSMSIDSMEGFIFEHNGTAFTNFNNTGDIPGEFTDYLFDLDTVRITWEGGLPDGSGLIIFQEVLIPKNELYALVRITILNASFDFQYGVKYMRSINPSPEQTAEIFETINTIESNFPDDLEAFVSAAGIVSPDNYFGIVSSDPRAKVSYATLDLFEEYFISDALEGNAPFNTSGTVTGDMTINIAFDMDSIYPCSAEMFSFAYIFSNDAETIEHALAATERDDYSALCTGVLYFDVNDISYTSASISYEAEEGMNYVIEYGPVGGAFSEFGTTDGTVALLGLDECTEYEVMVWSVCAGDTLPSISSQIFTTACSDTGTVIISAFENSGITLFPNPASSVLFIAMENPFANAVCTILNISGNAVLTTTMQDVINTTAIDISLLPSGMYIIELQMEDGIYREQLLITK